MAIAALDQIVRPFDQQPYGLERACVEKVATVAGKIYVDARFTNGGVLEQVGEQGCERNSFVVRFDWKAFVQSPSADVVLLSFGEETPQGRAFNAVIETSDWPKTRPGTMSLSECGSAFGRVRREAAGWKALVTPPPRPPDAL